MSKRTFYQSHTCRGFSAKVTIEWDIPPTVDEFAIRQRLDNAEDIADHILGRVGKQMRDMVQEMRGYPAPPVEQAKRAVADEVICEGCSEPLSDAHASDCPLEQAKTEIGPFPDEIGYEQIGVVPRQAKTEVEG